jgi:hypothetical protein
MPDAKSLMHRVFRPLAQFLRGDGQDTRAMCDRVGGL